MADGPVIRLEMPNLALVVLPGAILEPGGNQNAVGRIFLTYPNFGVLYFRALAGEGIELTQVGSGEEQFEPGLHHFGLLDMRMGVEIGIARPCDRSELIEIIEETAEIERDELPR
ncbi:hypothetical protein D3C84_928030 [compost metagenome]